MSTLHELHSILPDWIAKACAVGIEECRDTFFDSREAGEPIPNSEDQTVAVNVERIYVQAGQVVVVAKNGEFYMFRIRVDQI